ncbi:acid phosphatase [Coniochaeta ligniaria NRRL 30616]|uniref:Acid phosphatase n=1 Tax=Coniochaeta ligniaria NRRL 30616 TaxID=1408157 RepID=A0A1J7J6W7_9PEZI|nr:acid phosphatase [Coniochaeta ligniaria NRRL 30616]
MRYSSLVAASALALAGYGTALNILMNNDDGFGSGNLRELYKLLKANGHNVWIVAPATQQSGKGGSSEFTDQANLTANSQYDLIPAGAPSVGPDPVDSHIWYYNGTPAACTFVALDYVLPNFADFSTPDLVVTGPNYGTNLGNFVWTLSGTAGAAYSATARGIPAIALSGSNKAVNYKDVNSTSHPAYLVAALSAKIVQGVIDSAAGASILPLGYGLNVNFPPLSTNWSSLPVVQTRMTGNSEVDIAQAGAVPGTFTWGNIRPLAAGANVCLSGDCTLPDETFVVASGKVAMSLYITDYSAPTNGFTRGLMQRFRQVTGCSS